MRIPIRKLVAALFLLGVFVPDRTNASSSYTYDQIGRLTTALYDNGLCIGYAYDANGNRTSLISSSPQSAVWGSGSWGCFSWTP
jgi:YD repeat-containing protein